MKTKFLMEKKDISSWYKTEKNWRKWKSTIYLRENVYVELVKFAHKEKLSFSEMDNHLLEQGLRLS